jgi:chromosomal replication initiator protein
VVNGVSSILFSGSAAPSNGSPRFAALDQFVAGPENRVACVAARSVIGNEGRYSPLVLTGPPGSGKTHLALGLAAAWAANQPPGGLVVTTAAEFAQQLARAIQDREVDLFRRTYRTSKFMVLEDLGSLAGKVTAQQELLHMLDALVDDRAQVIVTCRDPLARAGWLLAGLRSRLSAGLEVPLAWPEAAARTVIVEELAAARGTQITKSAARALAEGITGSVPELLGVLTALEMARPSREQIISLEDVATHLVSRHRGSSISLRKLCALAARQFGLKVADLRSPSRQRTVVVARGVAMYLARQASGKTLVEIGRFFDGRDHSTVLHACRQIERLVHSDAETRSAVESLQAELHSRSVLRAGTVSDDE